MSEWSVVAASLFYSILFLITLVTISVTLYNFPLFPIQYDSLEWNRTWLVSTVVDYYGACLCFCGVVLSTETSWVRGSAWVAGFCLLGSPMCCLWVLLWLFREGGTLRLERRCDTHHQLWKKKQILFLWSLRVAGYLIVGIQVSNNAVLSLNLSRCRGCSVNPRCEVIYCFCA